MRKLQQAEHEIVRPLYKEVFSEDSELFVDYYFQEKTKDNQIYVMEDQEDVIAMIHLNPYELSVNWQLVQAHYIVAVATKEEFRGRGYMASLLRQAINDMYDEQEPFTFLMPASEKIYLPHDFRTVYEQTKRQYFEEEHGNSNYYKGEEKDAKELAEYANKYLAKHYHVYAKRSQNYYQRLMREYEADGGCLMLRREGGQISDCLHRMPHEEKSVSKIMIRIVALERMLMLLKLKRLTVVCFQVTDPIIEKNNKCIVLTGTEFSGAMVMEGELKNSEGILPVSVLGELIFGHMTVEESENVEGVQMTERMKAELKKIIPLSRIYLNEIV